MLPHCALANFSSLEKARSCQGYIYSPDLPLMCPFTRANVSNLILVASPRNNQPLRKALVGGFSTGALLMPPSWGSSRMSVDKDKMETQTSGLVTPVSESYGPSPPPCTNPLAMPQY